MKQTYNGYEELAAPDKPGTDKNKPPFLTEYGKV
jgi:hypothetical protein